MSLFNLKDVTLHSGSKSDWIIDCTALTSDDLDALARIATRMMGRFGAVVGIPKGGLPFAKALVPYVTEGHPCILLADDVCTTGNSFIEARDTLTTGVVPDNPENFRGIVIFARGPVPSWVRAIWTLHGMEHEQGK